MPPYSVVENLSNGGGGDKWIGIKNVKKIGYATADDILGVLGGANQCHMVVGSAAYCRHQVLKRFRAFRVHLAEPFSPVAFPGRCHDDEHAFARS